MLKVNKKYESLPWLAAQQARLRQMLVADKFPHALIVQGVEGMGRRQLTLWLAAEYLGAEVCRPVSGGEGFEPAHPDFIVLEAPYIDAKTGNERKTIGVELIRERLIPFLALTSHGDRGRVAVIYPADLMTDNAANSLLKTLEEPPAGTLIVLVTEVLARLPATVISRCQRVSLAAPDSAVAADWLAQQAPEHDFRRLLEFSGGAPLAALQLYEEGFSGFANKFLAAMDQLEQAAVSPVAVAADCRKQEALALRLLEWRLAERLRATAGASGGQDRVSRAGFQQLSQIRELRRVINGGINAELGLARLLLDWYGGLGHRQE